MVVRPAALADRHEELRKRGWLHPVSDHSVAPQHFLYFFPELHLPNVTLESKCTQRVLATPGAAVGTMRRQQRPCDVQSRAGQLVLFLGIP